MADVYHTFFGIAGLSLMGYPGLKAIDPAWALPVEVVERLTARGERAQEVGDGRRRSGGKEEGDGA